MELAATTKQKEKEAALSSFIYALKTKGTQEQYLSRLKIFFNFLEEIPGTTVEEQAAAFLGKVRKNPPEFAENCLISFIIDNKHKVEKTSSLLPVYQITLSQSGYSMK